MERVPSRLANRAFDVLVIGGGITGAFIALDAVSRGLSVALVERKDFGGATSAASSKILHGGIRYLQRLDLRSMRESAMERAHFQRMIPHLTSFVPFIIPTYRSFLKSAPMLKAALAAYGSACWGENSGIADPAKRIPKSRWLNRNEMVDRIPWLTDRSVTGGALLYESHMLSPERVTLAVLETAVAFGAVIANYLEARSFISRGNRILGVNARDLTNGEQFEVRARYTVNAAGPWISEVSGRLAEPPVGNLVTGLCKGAHIITRSLTDGYGVALVTKRRQEAVLTRGGRHYFIIPWRGHSLIGTTYHDHSQIDQSAHAIEECEISELIEQVNAAASHPVLSRADVRHGYAGLYPLLGQHIKGEVYQGGRRYRVFDHHQRENVRNLISVFSPKFTLSRRVAEMTVSLIAKETRKGSPATCQTREIRTVAGDIESMKELRDEMRRRFKGALGEEGILRLVSRYGRNVESVLATMPNGEMGRIPKEWPTLAAEVVYAVKAEMALHLDDVVFRRIGLGELGHPGKQVLQQCAQWMGSLLGWDAARRKREIEQCERHFLSWTEEGRNDAAKAVAQN